MRTIRILFSASLALFILSACVVLNRKTHDVVFLTEACIKPFKRYEYRTCDELRVTIDGNLYVVPKNFKTNLASIPRPLWPFIAPQYSAFIAPAILHDFLYNCPHDLDRKCADEALYSALLTQGVSQFTANKFYIAVRVFGSRHYDSGIECKE
jgi:hypothetical protein